MQHCSWFISTTLKRALVKPSKSCINLRSILDKDLTFEYSLNTTSLEISFGYYQSLRPIFVKDLTIDTTSLEIINTHCTSVKIYTETKTLTSHSSLVISRREGSGIPRIDRLLFVVTPCCDSTDYLQGDTQNAYNQSCHSTQLYDERGKALTQPLWSDMFVTHEKVTNNSTSQYAKFLITQYGSRKIITQNWR